MSAFGPIAAGPINLSSLTAGDIASVKNARDRENIGGIASRVWDKISDFFCGTQRAEAKKCLFELFSPLTTDAQKINHFFALKNLAGGGYEDRFQHAIADGRETYTLLLDGDEHGVTVMTREIIGVDREAVHAVLNSDRSAELKGQLTKDICRGHYAVDGQSLPADTALDAEARLGLFDNALDALHCSAVEKKSVLALCTQGTVSLIMEQAERKTSPDFPTGVSPQCPAPGEKVSSYSITREHGMLHVKVQFVSDMTTMKNEEERNDLLDMITPGNHIYRALQISLDVAIDHNGSCTVKQLDYLANKGANPA